MPNLKWSKEIVISEIKKRYNSNKYIDSRIIRNDYSKLYNAAFRYFGNWNNALKAAGINPYKIKKHHRKEKYSHEPLDEFQKKFYNVLMTIYYINNYAGANADFIANKLGVSNRTIHRYIREIRNIPEFEIIYVDQHNGYEIKLTHKEEEIHASRYMYIWTSKDMKLLEFLVNEGVSDKKIAQLLDRTIASIQQQRQKMGLHKRKVEE